LVQRHADETTLSQGLYPTYLLLGYDDIYDVYSSTPDVFRRRYVAIVEDGFDMRHFFDDVAAELPPPVRDLLKPSYYVVPPRGVGEAFNKGFSRPQTISPC
jgi:hypothetical protein